jgi:putative heme iron utilization protein
MSQPFTEDVIAAVSRHMNEDHEDDNVLIVRALGGRADATGARMTGMDGEGIDFAAAVNGQEVPVRVPFSRPLTQRAEVRPEVVRMYREACAALGLPARD